MQASSKSQAHQVDHHSVLSASHHTPSFTSPSKANQRPVSAFADISDQSHFQIDRPLHHLQNTRNLGLRHTIDHQHRIDDKNVNNGRVGHEVQHGSSHIPGAKMPLKTGHFGLRDEGKADRVLRTEVAFGKKGNYHFETNEPTVNKIMQKISAKQKLIQELKKLAIVELPSRTTKPSPTGFKQQPSCKPRQTGLTATSQASIISPSSFCTDLTLKQNLAAKHSAAMWRDIDTKGSNPQSHKSSSTNNGCYYTPRVNKNSDSSFLRSTFSNTRSKYTPSPLQEQKYEHKDNCSSSFIKKGHSYNTVAEPQACNLRATTGKMHDIVKALACKVSKKPELADFKITKTLGEGKFGTVFAASHIASGMLFALKKINKSVIKSHLMVDQLAVEIRIQSMCNHNNIVRLFDTFDDKENVYLILEYMEEGTLFALLKKHKTLKEGEAAEKIRQVAEAVKCLHDLGIAHRDIKPENIVMSNGIGKLCDFGWAAICNGRRSTYCGTFDYAAPQILEGNEYDMSVDLWCLGILAYELLVGKAPFYHISRKETMKKIMSADTQHLQFPSHLSPNAVSFIKNLLKKQPEERLTADALLNHPFLTQTTTQ